MLVPTSATETPAPPNPAFAIYDDAEAPSRKEIALLAAVTFAIFAAVILSASHYSSTVDGFGDSSSYIKLASAIRRWNFDGIVPKQFWGLPYAMAALSKLSGLSDRTSLLIFSFVPSFFSALLIRRLWNGWIAAYFCVLSFDWLQRSCLGGSEPLFVFLLLASFLAVRRDKWWIASLLASLATIVRPLGAFALLGIGLVLLWRRDFLKFAMATATGVVVGALYALPLATQFGDPLATVSSYHNPQWQGGWLFGFPFYAIIKGTVLYPAPWTNLLLSLGWIALVVFAVFKMAALREFRSYCRAHPVEAIFLVPYLWCLFTYNYPVWARSNFARFSIPVLPFVLLALWKWIPKDRWIVWAVGVVSPILAAGSALGVANAVRLVERAIH